MTMEEGMREKSLLLEGASDVVLSLEEEGFLRRLLALTRFMEESVDVLLIDKSVREGFSLCTKQNMWQS